MATAPLTAGWLNVADRLTALAGRMPDAIAVAQPRGRQINGRRRYDCVTFGQLDAEVAQVAVHGREIRTLTNGPSLTHHSQVVWDTTDNAGNRVSPGIYVCRLTTEDHSESRKSSVVE